MIVVSAEVVMCWLRAGAAWATGVSRDIDAWSVPEVCSGRLLTTLEYEKGGAA